MTTNHINRENPNGLSQSETIKKKKKKQRGNVFFGAGSSRITELSGHRKTLRSNTDCLVPSLHCRRRQVIDIQHKYMILRFTPRLSLA
jgi:hypothetical protein